MKKLVLAVSASIILFSCSKSLDKQAQSNIAEYLKTNMDDPSSYESIEFGKLDTLHSSFSDTKEGIKLNMEEDKLKQQSDDLSNKLDLPDLTMKDLKSIDSENEKITNRRKEINNILMDKVLTYKGEVNGYSMTHKFRGKNKLGAIILNEMRFNFDKKMVITGAE
jgi:hypothetical protein